MTRLPDPLITRAHAERLHYATGELLGADDFRDEQTYHRRQLARALLHLHGSGTLAGLRVVHRHRPGGGGAPDEVEIEVQPGLALDRAGRLIEVPREACLRLGRWYDFLASPDRTPTEMNARNLRAAFRADATVAAGGVVVADVFLAFHNCPHGYTPSFASGPFDALDASQPSRVRDAYELSLVLRTEADADLPAASDPWSVVTGGTAAARMAAAVEASLDLWHRQSEPAPENVGVEETAVLLARVRIPAAPNPNVNEAPQRDLSAAAWPAGANIDNGVRRVVLPVAAIRRVIGA